MNKIELESAIGTYLPDLADYLSLQKENPDLPAVIAAIKKMNEDQEYGTIEVSFNKGKIREVKRSVRTRLIFHVQNGVEI